MNVGGVSPIFCIITLEFKFFNTTRLTLLETRF
jgi:hypothetical protein